MRGFVSNSLGCRIWRALLASSALSLSACVPEYRPPAYDEPHAVVKARLVCHAWPGPRLDQSVMIDAQRLSEVPPPVHGGDGIVTRPVLVRPGTVSWAVRVAFFHTQIVNRTETYTTSQSYSCGKSICSRSTPDTRVVSQPVRVNDAVCEQAMLFQAAARERYIIQYDFFADQRCSLHCFQQFVGTDGTLDNAPCLQPAQPPAGR